MEWQNLIGPKYRGETYTGDVIIGTLVTLPCGLFEIRDMVSIYHMVSPETVCIHMPGMYDKNNKELFGSLFTNGIRGDKVRYNNKVFTIYYKSVNGRFEALMDTHRILAHKFKLTELIKE